MVCVGVVNMAASAEVEVDVVSDVSHPERPQVSNESMFPAGQQEDVEMKVLDGEGAESRAVLVARGGIQEESVTFIIKDVTDPDWKKPRLNCSLPLSTAIVDLYDAVAKQAGEWVGPLEVGVFMEGRVSQLSQVERSLGDILLTTCKAAGARTTLYHSVLGCVCMSAHMAPDSEAGCLWLVALPASICAVS